MTAASAYARLRSLGSSALTTGEAAAALHVSKSSASRALRTLAAEGLVRRVRYGLWTLETGPIDPRMLVPDITRPYPAYVSFESALSAHGMIDQLPREITVASLDRAKVVKTSLGTFAVHHLPPQLFGGFESQDGLRLATPEKALFDYYYVARAQLRTRRRPPEVDLPDRFSQRRLESWVQRISSDRLKEEVSASLRRVIERARDRTD